MPVTVPEAFVNSEVRSLGRLVYEVFGGSEPILLERDQRKDRPYWRIDGSSTTTVTRAASGWDDGQRIYVVGYYGLGRQAVMEKIDVFRNAIRNAVPFYVFDGKWLNPRIEVLPADGAGPNLAAGSYSVSCSFLSMHGEETLPSNAFGVTLASPGRLRVYAPAWPFQAPLRGSARFYVGPSAGARLRAAEVPYTAYGWPSAVLSAVPSAPGDPEVSKSRMYLGPLRVNSLNVNTFEHQTMDGHFDAVMSLYCSREMQLDLWNRSGWRPYQEGEVTVSPADPHDPDALPSEISAFLSQFTF